jgi:hypothetical protein
MPGDEPLHPLRVLTSAVHEHDRGRDVAEVSAVTDERPGQTRVARRGRRDDHFGGSAEGKGARAGFQPGVLPIGSTG